MLKKFAQCCGLASLVLLENYTDFLGGGANMRMHVPFPVTGLALANVLDILLLTLLLFCVLAPLSRTPIYPSVKLLLAVAIPLYFLERLHALLPFTVPRLLPAIFTAAWLTLLLILFFRFTASYWRLMRIVSQLAVAFALFAFFSVAQLLLLFAWKPGPHAVDSAWSNSAQPAREHPKLVWIVFDELSYDQLFADRDHSLALPNFDELRSMSTLETKVQPIGNHTVSILPSLLAGRVVDDYRFRWSNELDLHFAGVRGWHAANGRDSIFGDAEQAGWRTDAVGWYNPYCTVYGSAIGDCYWTNSDMIQGPMAQNQTLTQNTFAPLSQLLRHAISPSAAARFECDFDLSQRLQTHLDLEEHALKVLRKDQSDLVFLHLPVPHSPNIWNRSRAAYTVECGSSYLDNLALADRELGRMLAILKSSPRWQQTTVIVEGDHSWRVPLWRALPAWTQEDDAASHDAFDPRPAVIVHQAGQAVATTNTGAWSLLNVHQVVEQVLRAGLQPHSNPPQEEKATSGTPRLCAMCAPH